MLTLVLSLDTDSESQHSIHFPSSHFVVGFEMPQDIQGTCTELGGPVEIPMPFWSQGGPWSSGISDVTTHLYGATEVNTDHHWFRYNRKSK